MPSTDEAATGHPPSSRHTIGELLRETRQSCGGDVDRIAATLRIRAAYLRAIEDGHYDRLPGPVYALGFVRAYANHLGLDAEEAVRRFKQETAGFDVSRDLSFPVPLSERSIPGGTMLLAALILAVCGYGLWYYVSTGEHARSERVSAVPPELTETPKLPPPVVAPAKPAASAAAAGAGAVSSGPAAPATKAAANAATNTAASGAATASTTSASAAPKAAPASAKPPATATEAAAPPAAAASAKPTSTAPAPASSTAMPPSVAAAAPSAAPATSVKTSSTATFNAATPSTTPPSTTPPSTTPPSTTPPSTTMPGTTSSSATASATPPNAPASTAAATGAASAAPASATAGASASPYQPHVYGVPTGPSDIMIRATKDSWVRISDPSGQILTERILHPGDSVRVPQQPGLVLTTGNASGLVFDVKGKTAPGIGGTVRHDIALNPAKLLAGTAASSASD